MADPVRIIAALRTPQRLLRKYCFTCFLMVFLPSLLYYPLVPSLKRTCATACANVYIYYSKSKHFTQATLSRSIYQSFQLFFRKKQQMLSIADITKSRSRRTGFFQSYFMYAISLYILHNPNPILPVRLYQFHLCISTVRRKRNSYFHTAVRLPAAHRDCRLPLFLR